MTVMAALHEALKRHKRNKRGGEVEKRFHFPDLLYVR